MTRHWLYGASMIAGLYGTAFYDAGSAQAQTAAAADDDAGLRPGDDIIVTARRRAESIQSVPVSITVVSAADLEQRGSGDISDAAQSVPNLSFNGGAATGAGSSNSAQIYVRGIGQDDYLPTADPGVGIYVDEIYLGRTSGSLLSLLDIAQVEVLRGPQGTLFGRNTIGGAILVRTRKPEFDAVSGTASVTLGTHDLIDAKSAINVPLGSTVAMRLTAGLRKQDGLGRSTQTAGQFGNTDRWGLAGSLRWAATERLEVNLSGDYSKVNQNGPAQVLTVAGPSATATFYNTYAAARGLPLFNPAITSTDRYRSSAQFLGYDNSTVGGVGLRADYKLSDDWTFRSITGWRSAKAAFFGDSDSSAVPLIHVGFDLDQNQFSQEVQANGEIGKLTLTTGAYYFQENIDYSVSIGILPGLYQYLTGAGICTARVGPCGTAASGYLEQQELKVHSYAGFAQASYAFADWISVTGGIRYSKDTKDDHVRSNRIATGEQIQNTNRKKSWDSITTKAGIEIKPMRDLMLYASYATGFKAGTFNSRIGASTPLTSVEPEEATSYEIGFKSQFLNRRVTLNVAAFTIDYTDLQTTVSIIGSIPPATALVNAAAARSKGVEAELTLLPIDDLRITAAYGYNDAKITEATAGASLQNIKVGNRLAKTPKNKISLAAQYRIPIGEASVTPRVDYTHQSSMFHNAQNFPAHFEPSYGILNARLTFTGADDRWSFSVFGTNLTDEGYAVNRNFTAGFNAGSVNYARAEEYGATFSVKF